jgi:hypothetical protein
MKLLEGEDIIEMDPKNVKCENVDCIQLADYRDR